MPDTEMLESLMDKKYEILDELIDHVEDDPAALALITELVEQELVLAKVMCDLTNTEESKDATV